MNNKIKVCHFVSGLKSGGVESMIYNYCSHMSLEEYKMYLVYQHEPSQKNLEEFEKLNFVLKRIPSKVKHPLKNFVETYKFLKNNRIDIVHCHMTLMNVFPLLAAKILNIKIRICHSHNSDVRKKNIIVSLFEKVLKKVCIYLSTDLVACGVDAGKYMYSNNRFIILNNALDLNKFMFNKENRNKIRKIYNIKDDEILIGHIGRFTSQKNHEFIIKLFEKLDLNKFKLILIGDGELKESIEKEVSKKNISSNIIFAGIQSKIYEFYSAFDIFILPSLWEGLPVVSIEAQASGVFCIFSDNIDKDAIINIDKSILLNLDIGKWCKYIKMFSNKSNNRSIDISKFIEKNLDINNEVLKLDRIYRRILDENRY